MSRPVRIKSAGVAIFANDVLIHRAQRFGTSGRLDSEDIKEIGNLGIVEVSENVPTVEITMDTNQSGILRTIGALTQTNFSWGFPQLKISAAGTSGNIDVSSGVYFSGHKLYTLAADSDYDLDGDGTLVNGKYISGTGSAMYCSGNSAYSTVVTVYIDNAGALAHTGSAATTGTPVPISVPTNARLKIGEVYVQGDTTTIYDRYIANRNDWAATPISMGTGSDHCIELKDFETTYVDFVIPIMESGDNETFVAGEDDIDRSVYIEKGYATRYNASIATNGAAAENFSLETDNMTHYLDTAKVIYTHRFDGDGSSTGYAFTTGYPDVTGTSYSGAALLPGDKYILTVLECTSGGTYNEYTRTLTDYKFSDDSGTGIIFDGTTVPANGSVVKVRYCVGAGYITDAPQDLNLLFHEILPNPEDHEDTQPAGALKGQHIEVYLTDNTDGTADSGEKVLRLQSCNIDASLNRDPLYEIGAIRAYSRPVQFPLPITIGMETLANDLTDFAKLCGKASLAAAGNKLSILDFVKTLDLVVHFYRTDNETRDGFDEGDSLKNSIHRPWKTIWIPNLSMTDTNFEVSVDANATQTFNMKANTHLYWLGTF